MMEKQNRLLEKMAAGDAGTIDDIVSVASHKMEKAKAQSGGLLGRRSPHVPNKEESKGG